MRLSEWTEQIEPETEYEDGEPDECPKCQELNRVVEGSTEFIFCAECDWEKEDCQ